MSPYIVRGKAAWKAIESYICCQNCNGVRAMVLLLHANGDRLMKRETFY